LSFYGKLKAFGSKTALIHDSGKQYTYAALASLSDKLADSMERQRKSLVLILAGNNVESIVGYLAGLRSGNAVMILNAHTDAELLDGIISVYAPDYIWRPSENPESAVFSWQEYNLFYLDNHVTVSIDKDLALLLPTSGSTGSPKMVRLSKENLESNARAITSYLGLDETERAITALPVYFSYGLSVLNTHLLAGATMLLTDSSMMNRDFWDFFKKEKPTSLAGVPYMYEMLKRLKFFEMDIGPLRYMTQAGGKLRSELVQEFAVLTRDKGINFYVMYGQTEATARISYLPPEKNIEKSGSIGLPIDGGRMWVVAENGKTVSKPYCKGELFYSGSNVMMGYADSREDLSKGFELGGVLRTGDIAYFDEEDYFYIVGRMKRFLKIFGNRVNLEDIEHYLHSLGCECVCGGEDNRLMIACAALEDTDVIKDTVVKKYGFHPSVVEIFGVPEIMKNAAGKIMYQEVFKDLKKNAVR
jgi:acyl-CoA synthetase (AMP-forming)/AMP-acid ligase II